MQKWIYYQSGFKLQRKSIAHYYAPRECLLKALSMLNVGTGRNEEELFYLCLFVMKYGILSQSR